LTAAPAPRLDLPAEPHLPGRTPRPPEEVFARLKAGLTPGPAPASLLAAPAFAAGLEAFRARYYWEAHELWEAVWICLPPAAAERLLLRGLIQLANAGLKARLGRAAAKARILALADAALGEYARRRRSVVPPLDAGALAALRRQAAGETASG